ncbi:MAG: type II toxin-antitoxin system ParD family antitoxin [Planctomycetes bacterium]|nr:type II toxin-antitoxin system ParD family antitoxin [Planctomycetota bacterium]
MTSMNVSLTTSLRSFAELRSADGYGSVSEYVRELIRQDRKRTADGRVDELLLEGLSSGEPIEATRECWRRKRRNLKARRKHKGRR